MRMASNPPYREDSILSTLRWLHQPEALQLSFVTGQSLWSIGRCLQAAVYGSRDATLTPEIFRRVLDMKLREHEQRKGFQAEQ